MEVSDEKPKVESLSTANAVDSKSVRDLLPRIEKDKHDEPPGLDESSYSGSGGYSGSGANSSTGAYSGSGAAAVDVERKKKILPVEPIMVSVHACVRPASIFHCFGNSFSID
jgi:hypothetical protein